VKVIYEFEDDDSNQRQLFEKGHDFYIALFDIDNLMRTWRKEELETIEDYNKLLEEIADKVWESGMTSIQ